jgi:hypothetical protein
VTKRERNWLLLALAAYLLLRKSKDVAATSAPAIPAVTNKTTTVDKGDGQGEQPLPPQPGRVKSIDVEKQGGGSASADNLPAVPEGAEGLPESTPVTPIQGYRRRR